MQLKKEEIPVFKRFLITGDSLPGLIRKRNEDTFVYAADQDGKYLLTAVADGIGGGHNGDIASTLTCKILLREWRKFQIPKFFINRAIAKFLKKNLSEISDKIHQLSLLAPRKEIMGTTLAAAVFTEKSVIIIHAGDSRVYRVRQGRIEQLTIDHNVATDMIRHDKVPEEIAQSHPEGRLLTQAVGPLKKLHPEISIHPLRSGDRFLFCTDGLTLHVNDQELCQIITENTDPVETLDDLLEITYLRGARDNVTILNVWVI